MFSPLFIPFFCCLYPIFSFPHLSFLSFVRSFLFSLCSFSSLFLTSYGCLSSLMHHFILYSVAHSLSYRFLYFPLSFLFFFPSLWLFLLSCFPFPSPFLPFLPRYSSYFYLSYFARPLSCFPFFPLCSLFSLSLFVLSLSDFFFFPPYFISFFVVLPSAFRLCFIAPSGCLHSPGPDSRLLHSCVAIILPFSSTRLFLSFTFILRLQKCICVLL